MKIRRRRRRNPWLSSGQEAAPAFVQTKRAGRVRPLQRREKKKAPNRSSGPFVNLSRRRPTFPHKKAPNRSSGPFVNLSRRRPTFPHSYPCSIIGPARLNFRVRDGNGCDPRGMTTGNSKKFSVISSKFSVSEKAWNQENFESFRKRLARRDEAPRTTVLAGEYKFGPLPNKYCVLQDVADWSRNQPAMNFISKPWRGPSLPKSVPQGVDP